MIEVTIAIGIFWLYCGVMSLLAKEDIEVIHTPVFHAATVVVYVGLMCWCASALVRNGGPAMGIIAAGFAVAAVAIFGVLLGMRWLGLMLGHYVEALHSAAIGTANMKVQKTYDKAGKAEHEGRWQDAIDIYLQEAATAPSEPEPLRRAGEAYLKSGKPEECAAFLQKALALVQSPEDRASLAFRLAEVLVRELSRKAEARSVIENVAIKLQGTKFEEFAKERLRSLSVT